MGDKEIDKLLKTIYDEELRLGFYSALQQRHFSNNLKGWINYKNLLRKKIYEELNLILEPTNTKVVLSERGKEISTQGGWLVYKEKTQSENKKNKDKQDVKENLEIENLEWNTKVAKWQVKTRYYPYIVSTIGLVLSWISLYHSTRPLKEHIIEKIERPIDVGREEGNTSTLFLPKKSDSLRVSKNSIDSSSIDMKKQTPLP